MFFSLIKDLNKMLSNFLNLNVIQDSLPSEELKIKIINQIEDYSIFQVAWKIFIFFLIKLQNLILYFLSFGWLRDFAYLPVSFPNISEKISLLPPSIHENWDNLLELIKKANVNVFFSPEIGQKNIFESFLVSNESWSLSALYPSWFDSISPPVHFITTEVGEKSLGYQEPTIFNLLIIGILIGLSSFFNSFLINFPLAISNILSLRYFIIRGFTTGDLSYVNPIFREPDAIFDSKTITPFLRSFLEKIIKIPYSLLSVLGIILGEVFFMFLLILPPPFIQITLTYLESVCPYIFGIILIVFIIYEACKIMTFPGLQLSRNKTEMLKVFVFCFLFSFTEQSCYFSYFGNLNLSSTANFFDTYIFSASLSPIILIFSCFGFLSGSFFAITIYNFCLSQLIYLLFFCLYYKVFPWIEKKKPVVIETTFSFFKKIDYIINYPSTSKTVINYPKLFVSLVFSFLISIYKSFKVLMERFVKLINLLFFSILKIGHIRKNFFTNNYFMTDKNRKKDFDSRNYEPLADLSLENVATTKYIFPDRFKKADMFPKIEKFLLIGLISLTFTTIPYYGFDYLLNNFLGFTPQDDILNHYSLNLNLLPDYGPKYQLGGEPDDDEEELNVIGTDVTLYDRADYRVGEWSNSFESLNYQAEYIWRNQTDYSRYKQKLKARKSFKDVKKAISVTWKQYKKEHNRWLDERKQRQDQKQNKNKTSQSNQEYFSKEELDFPSFFSLFRRKDQLQNSDKYSFSFNTRKKNNENLKFLFSSFVSPKKDPMYLKSTNIKEARKQQNFHKNIKVIAESALNSSNRGEDVEFNHPFKLKDKKVITEKYYQNPIYQIILSNDLKNFLKSEPLSQQLTSIQERDLSLLRLKMTHYYDSLRFYTEMQEELGQYSVAMNTDQEKNSDTISFQLNDFPTKPQQSSDFFVEYPPFESKSMTSLNYRQQFKGSYQKVRQLFKISLINKKQVYSQFENNKVRDLSTSQTKKQNSELFKQNFFNNSSNHVESANSEKISAKSDSRNPRNSGQPNFFSKKFNKIKVEKEDPILSFEKSLFNEYPYDENSFLHEEVLLDENDIKNEQYLDEATLDIYDIFGSNDPFYVGWDKNLRKFVLTSRILFRPNSLLKEKTTNDSSLKPYSENRIRQSENFLHQEEEEEETELDKNEIYSQLFFDQRQNKKPQFYQFYSSWPFFRHQLKNSKYRPYSVLYENATNIADKNLKICDSINHDITDDQWNLLKQFYDFNFVEKKENKSKASQTPIYLYKQILKPKRRQVQFFTPTQRSFSWPGSIITTTPLFEYFMYDTNADANAEVD